MKVLKALQILVLSQLSMVGTSRIVMAKQTDPVVFVTMESTTLAFPMPTPTIERALGSEATISTLTTSANSAPLSPATIQRNGTFSPKLGTWNGTFSSTGVNENRIFPSRKGLGNNTLLSTSAAKNATFPTKIGSSNNTSSTAMDGRTSFSPKAGAWNGTLSSSTSGNRTVGKAIAFNTSHSLPTIKCSAGTIVGKSSEGIDSFLGIPYALPPTNSQRLKPPSRLMKELNNFDATKTPKSCLQGNLMSFLKTGDLEKRSAQVNYATSMSSNWMDNDSSEDCLSVVIQRPTGTKADAKLPVLFWIHGGGFLIGSNNKYDASDFVKAGVKAKQPFIFVAVNYRLGGWGFLPGLPSRYTNATNLGLRDQRMGLEWVADNIGAFGGDPSKVTIWGESAGAISVFDQLIMNDGNATYNKKPLFRGAIMNSGSLVPAEPVAAYKGQDVFNKVAAAAGCGSTDDAMACLRGLPSDEFKKAVNTMPGIISYQSLALTFLPRPDGVVLTDSPDVLIKNGKIFEVPMIIGNQEDEGTLFAQTQKNMSTTEQIVEYLWTYYFFGAGKRQLTELVSTYDPDPAAGSPYRTGKEFEEYPGKKRLSSLLGDLVFAMPRRLVMNILKERKPKLKMWSYFSSYKYRDGFNSFVGTAHGTDVEVLFNGEPDSLPTKSGREYYLNFLYNLDPNVGTKGLEKWPEWSPREPQMLWFNKTTNGLLADNFRNESYQWIAEHANSLYI